MDRSAAAMCKHFLWVLALTTLALVTCGVGCGSSEKDSAAGEANGDGDDSLSTPKIRLFYFVSQVTSGDPASDPNSHKIKSAVSSDGINFTEEADIRFERVQITDPDLFQVSASEFVMFVSQGTNLIKATSATQGGTFVEDGSFQWSGGAVSSTAEIDGTLMTFHCANGISTAPYDRETGQLGDAVQVLSNTHGSGIICDPSVVRLSGGTYVMYYKWTPAGNVGPSEHQVYSATSPDGTNFTATGTLIRDQASVPGAVKIDDRITLYFVDGSGGLSPTGSIAVGISTDEGATFSFQPVLIDGSTDSGAVDPNPVPFVE